METLFFTKNSEKLMAFFHKRINPAKSTATTKNIMRILYNDIKKASNYVDSLSPGFYKLHVHKITTVSQIPLPTLFSADSFPPEIRTHINNTALRRISYTFSLFERKINIQFIVEDRDKDVQIEFYNHCVKKMIVWLYVVNEYASNVCSRDLTIYLYFTSLTKSLPTSNIDILNEMNVNTAFTSTCPTGTSEIVIFRKEEWFKVFIHETFHNFALDFSDMHISNIHNRIRSTFKVSSDINLFEAYTEFWAEIMNCAFCSYTMIGYTEGLSQSEDIVRFERFFAHFEYLIQIEIAYSFFQLVKVLHFMGLQYSDLYSTSKHSEYSRSALYKEKTNVLSYYIITCVLLSNWQQFLSWCSTNNLSLIQFKKTNANLQEFCKFIEKKYKSRIITDGVNDTEGLFVKCKTKSNGKNRKESDSFLLTNLRMTIIELV